jgi:hypothetical protein
MQESAEYVARNIDLHKLFPDRLALLDRCLELIPGDGLILEFGVYKGETLRHIAKRLPGRQIFGFDSFEGLKEPWVFHNEGAFGDISQLPSAPENVTLIKGWFQDTALDFLGTHSDTIALLHVDSDLYSSCKYILDTYGQRLKAQSIIVFDEFFNYPRWMDGEFKAFREWCDMMSATYEFIGFTAQRGFFGPGQQGSGQQVAVRIVSLGGQMTQVQQAP